MRKENEVIKQILDFANEEDRVRGLIETLSIKEREILLMLNSGLSNKEIGFRLNLAEITVKIHISSIFRALGVVNRTQAVLEARKMGLYTPGM